MNCMHRLANILVLCLVFGYTYASDPDYSFKAIPVNLLDNSNTVVRLRENVLEIGSARKAVLKVRYAVTVTKDNGIDNAIFMVGYNRYLSIKHLKGIVYDADGKKVERMEQKDFYDLSAIPGYATYEDNRVVFCRPRYQTIPFTVEYSYEIDFNGIIDFPDFYLFSDFNCAVESANLIITAPDEIGVSYFQRNFSSACKIEKTKSGQMYSWGFRNIPSIRREPFSLPITDLSPAVLVAPHLFELEGYLGSTESWHSFGLWDYELNSDRDKLGEETIKKIKAIVSGISDSVEKIRILYDYFQHKTRYASIQIGIGGWQTAMASEVDRLGYGDCKALTNYMKAILNVAGIQSYPVLIFAGKDVSDILSEFPSNQFNHVILCVPVKKDTLWLECTSQDLPMGYLGTFTDDRTGLLITKTGGNLCRTSSFGADINSTNIKGQAAIGINGSAVISVIRKHRGKYYDEALTTFKQDETDRRKSLIESIAASSFVLDSFYLKEHKSEFPVIEEAFLMNINNLAVQSGANILFVPNQLSKEKFQASQIVRRFSPVTIKRSESKIDTIYYSLPTGLTFTGNHINQDFSSKFGHYRAVTSMEGQKIRYIRQLVINKGVYPKEYYGELLDFFGKVASADEKKIALKSTQPQEFY